MQITADEPQVNKFPPWHRFIPKAKDLLENYAHVLSRKAELEETLLSAIRYTKDDALYLLSGAGGIRTDQDKVQTGNISNPCQNAVLNADALVEQLNRATYGEEERELEKLNRDISTVKVALALMEDSNPETANVARQIFAECRRLDDVEGLDGQRLSRYKSAKEVKAAIEELAKFLMDEADLKRKARQQETFENFEEDIYD